MTVKEDLNGLVTQIYDCYTDVHDVSTVGIVCTLVTANSVTECCNTTDLCNKYLNVTLPEKTPQPTLITETSQPQPSNGSKGKNYNSYRCALVCMHCRSNPATTLLVCPHSDLILRTCSVFIYTLAWT